MISKLENNKYYMGIFEGHYDPSVALVKNGKVIAYCEEERFLRFKHAPRIYPINSLKYCLEKAKITISEVEAVGLNWNIDAFSNGEMEKFYRSMEEEYEPDQNTKSWQKGMLKRYNRESIEGIHHFHWRKVFGDVKFPQIIGLPHHYVHAFQTCFQSNFNQAIALTIDGSGDQHTTVVWKYTNKKLSILKEFRMPDSLGWFYAAITEYLGFHAYNCEYKVMGLAAYGKFNQELKKKIDNIITKDQNGFYKIDPTYIHYGQHSYSDRFTDKLVELFDSKPRLETSPISSFHEDLAFAAQKKLEEVTTNIIEWAINETGIKNVCIGGGVGLNIKMNSNLFENQNVNDLFAHPLCNDGGAAQGAALALCFKQEGVVPEKLNSLAFGPDYSIEEIEKLLTLTGQKFYKSKCIADEIAGLLARGKIIGWFQGSLEGGPRALGQRSILADPRYIENRDKVNNIIKFREYWRPFCPSMLVEHAEEYLEKFTDAKFMILAFKAKQKLKDEAPAIVHVDGTTRVQLVEKEYNPNYHDLISSFKKITDVPVLMNTSFNIKGEPIVTSPADALRTFWATGLEVLAIEEFIILKPGVN